MFSRLVIAERWLSGEIRFPHETAEVYTHYTPAIELVYGIPVGIGALRRKESIH